MKTRTLFYSFLISSAFGYQANAQIIHNPLDPDEVIDIIVGTGNNVKMDLDGDSQDDVLFVYTNYPSFGIWNIGITQIDTSDVKIEILYDASIPPSQIGDYYAKQLIANADISATALYTNDYPQIGDIYNANFTNQTGKYIGFRLVSGSDFQYGWMSVELSGTGDYTFTIKEFAYQSTPNTAIKAGETSTVGIVYHDFSENHMSFYPNPAKDVIRLKSSKDSQLDLVNVYNLEGQLIKTWNYVSMPTELDMSFLRSGTYLIQARSDNNMFQELLIIE